MYFTSFWSKTMSEYNPDYWQVIKVTSTEGKVFYKVFGTWVGGYVQGESWRMNSGIKSVEEEGDYLLFHGFSGSTYKVVNKDFSYRTVLYTQSVLDYMMQKCDKVGAKMELLPFETTWKELNYDTTT